jgi:hypothetical protein
MIEHTPAEEVAYNPGEAAVACFRRYRSFEIFGEQLTSILVVDQLGFDGFSDLRETVILTDHDSISGTNHGQGCQSGRTTDDRRADSIGGVNFP